MQILGHARYGRGFTWNRLNKRESSGYFEIFLNFKAIFLNVTPEIARESLIRGLCKVTKFYQFDKQSVNYLEGI